MGMVTALDKFYEVFDQKGTDNVCFASDGMYYTLSYPGRFIITEDLENQEEYEYCFGEHGKDLTETILNAKVNRAKDTSIREILAGLPPEKLLV